jgi:hypothetical protein
MDKSNVQEVKTCSKCNTNKNKDEKKEKTCKTCKKTFSKFLPYLFLSLVVFGFAVYGVVIFVKNMIELLSK